MKCRNTRDCVGFWCEAYNFQNDIENIIVHKVHEKSPYEMWDGELPRWTHNLRTFGEIGISRRIKVSKSKLENRGVDAVFLGYVDDHNGYVYRMTRL